MRLLLFLRSPFFQPGVKFPLSHLNLKVLNSPASLSSSLGKITESPCQTADLLSQPCRSFSNRSVSDNLRTTNARKAVGTIEFLQSRH
ncbi:hypothetical protein [Roseibium aggregatum]|uniref:hypothetical protein n=1 Tax=Roseibium aggregatum TaxID=187304 RepID=UPI0011A7F351|nr:hypothetical protein [Roseibium aggregatum]